MLAACAKTQITFWESLDFSRSPQAFSGGNLVQESCMIYSKVWRLTAQNTRPDFGQPNTAQSQAFQRPETNAFNLPISSVNQDDNALTSSPQLTK